MQNVKSSQEGTTIEIDRFISGIGDGAASERVGGKGGGLDRLIRAGFPVPAGFVLDSNLLDVVLRSNGRSPENPGEFDQSLNIPAYIIDRLMTEIEELGCSHVAVRSSAIGEDGDLHSYAGQYHTTLDVPADDRDAVASALRATWGSLYSAHALAYEASRTEEGNRSIAVVVQKMVAADLSGVLFTVDPVGGSTNLILNVVRGSGEKLVSGEVTPEEITVPRTGALSETSEDTLLNQTLRSRLRELALAVEELEGSAQDIEFSIEKGEVFLLQARPVTAVGSSAEGSRDPLEGISPVPLEAVPPESGFWESAAKDFTQPVSPITVDLYFSTMSEAIGAFFREFGVLLDGMEMKVIGGHPYTRMVPPGGKDGAPPPPFLMKILFRLVPSLRSKVRTAVRAIEEGRDQHYVDLWHSTWRPELDRWIENFLDHDLSEMPERELLEVLEDARGRMTTGMRAHFLVLPAHFLALSDLYFFLEEHLDWSKEKIARLTCGVSTETSAGTHALGRLARLATDYLGSAPVEADQVRRLREENSKFSAEVERYRRGWGLMIQSFDLDAPIEAEDPGLIDERIVFYASVGYDPDQVEWTMKRRREEAAEEARESLRKIAEGLDTRFDLLLKKIDIGLPVRDDTGLKTMRLFGAIRLLLLEIGGRLQSTESLESPDDVVYLKLDELRDALLRGGDLRPTVLLRKGERKWAMLNPGPPSWGKNPGDPPPVEVLPKGMQRIMKGLFWQIENDLAPSIPVDQEGGINGIGASVGVVTGRVRVIRDVREFEDLRQGEILVCPMTTPAWGSVFPLIGGIVADAGGVLSHPAIIAREFGVPAVVGAGSATTRLKTGDLVRLDGSTGRVEVLVDPS